MKSFDTDIKKYADKTRLKAAERDELRSRIVAYMEYHPLPRAVRAQADAPLGAGTLATARSLFSRSISFVSAHTLSARIGASALMILLVVSVPFAAEHAAPGDVLYPIKTRFNEPILSQFNTSPYKKVSFETELMERRIAEARLLAKEGKLNEETEAALAQSIKGHADAAQEGINALKESDAEGAAIAEITLGSVLDVQSAVLASGTTTANTQTSGIASAVLAAKTAVDSQRGTTTPSYDRLFAHVSDEALRAHVLFDSIKASATDEERKNMELRLADIDAKIASIKEAHDTGSATTSVMTLAKAIMPNETTVLGTLLGDLKKLIAFMTDIDVRNSVTLDTLVPITTSKDKTLAAYADLAARYDAVEQKINTVTDTDLKTEARSQDAELGKLMETASSTAAEGDVSKLDDMLDDLTERIETLESLLVDIAIPDATTTPVTQLKNHP